MRLHLRDGNDAIAERPNAARLLAGVEVDVDFAPEFLTAWGNGFDISRATVTYTGGLRPRGDCGYDHTQHPDWIACAAAAAINVDPNGVDSTGTGSLAAPFRTVQKAIKVANLGGTAARIVVNAENAGSQSHYNKDVGFTAGTYESLAVPCMFVIRNGIGLFTTCQNGALVWGVDATYTSTYATTRSTVASVWDRLNLDEKGTFRPFAKVSSPAICNAKSGGSELAGTWHLTAALAHPGVTTTASSTAVSLATAAPALWLPGMTLSGAGMPVDGSGNPTGKIVSIATDRLSLVLSAQATASGTVTLTAQPYLLVNRSDGQPVSDTNTLVLLDVKNAEFAPTAQVSIMFTGETAGDGWLFWGGLDGNGTIVYGSAGGQSGKLFYAKNVSAMYSGADGTSSGANGFGINSFGGLVLLDDCVAARTKSDGFNGHNAYGAAMRVVTQNCRGIKAGRANSQSNNGLTHHENVVALDLCSEFDESYGWTVHVINSSALFCAETLSANGKPDVAFGGSYQGGQFRASDTSRLWLWRCTARPAPGRPAILATDAAQLHSRDLHPFSGTTRKTGTAVLDEVWA